MTTRRQYNLILLGQSGVGKTTFINSLSNYMTYQTFEEALEANHPKVVIDSSFSVTHATAGSTKTIKINMRGLNPPEVEGGLRKTGKSSTTIPAVYSFSCNDIKFNIIDVPGAGDTQGIEQDAKNRQAILKEMNRFDEIHGICIMFKNNLVRYTNELIYCINEILSCLHKSAQDNIFFIVTHSSGLRSNSGFVISGIDDILQLYIKELNTNNKTNIILDGRIFAIDNEPFRFLCGCNQSTDFKEMFHTPENINRMKYLWENSRENIFSLLSKLYKISSHKTEESKLVGQISFAVQSMMNIITDVMKCIAEAKTDIYKEKCIRTLMGEGTFYKPDLEIKEKSPILICTDENCVQINKNNKNLKFKQICHENCQLTDVKIAHQPEPKLLECSKIDFNSICKVCKHHVDKHMLLPYQIYQKSTMIKDNKKKLTKNEAEKIFNKFIIELKTEQGTVLEHLMIFLIYSNNNAIITYNTAFLDKIKLEKQSQLVSPEDINKQTSKNLDEIADAYKQQIQAYQAIDQVNMNVGISRVMDSINKLTKMRHYGKTIEKLFNNQLLDKANITYNDFISLYVRYIPLENEKN